MRWFLKSLRTTWATLAAVLLGIVSAVSLGQSITVPVIDSSQIFGMLPFTALFPLVIVIGVGGLVASASPITATQASKAHADLLCLFAMSVCLLFGLSHLVALKLTGVDYDLGAIRNVFGYLALLFLGQSIFQLKWAPVAPAAYLFLATVFGRINGEVQPWGWPVLTGSWIDVYVAAGASIASGLIVISVARRSPARFYGV